jgi:iron complex outermembrane recepter protein
MFRRTKVCSAVMLACGGTLAMGAAPVFAQQVLEAVEVTGSRIKRADAEGSMPVTVIKREELEASGAVSVAEFMRTSTFASGGNFRPQSGSSAQSLAEVDLRALGANRTLVLIDGRRVPKGPQIGDRADLNTIPMAAIERIEILTDGASAIYGSDAIAGVVNFITRKDFEGGSLVAGYTKPSQKGGERAEASAIMGMMGEKGRVLFGASRASRAMVFTRDRPWGSELGISSFGNNYRPIQGTPPASTGAFTAIGNIYGDPALGCTDPDFYLTAGGTCSFNFNSRAADEAEIDQSSVFARGEHKITKDWTAYLNASVSRTESFGRYAPTPAQLTVQPTGPNTSTTGIPNSNNPFAVPIVVRHRTAAAGNRDTSTDNNLYDFQLGAKGSLSTDIEIDAGGRSSTSKYFELGRNYIVRPILEQYVNSNQYNLYAPNANSPAVLSAIKATIGREAKYSLIEGYGTATFSNVFPLAAGGATVLVGAENRKEKYADIYDSLSEAGVIEGSAGNSAAGTRTVSALYSELVMPVSKEVEVSLAARYEKYSDYGSDFSPKVAVRFQPMKSVTLRASAGAGFAAPSLPLLTKKETFSAESVIDPATCIAFGGTLPACNTQQVQVDSYSGANAALKSEKSSQFSFGSVWDATDFLSVKADYYNIQIKDRITEIEPQHVINRSNGSDPRPMPAGMYVQRDASGAITRVQFGDINEGTEKISGIDLTIDARWKLADVGDFNHQLSYTRVLKRNEDGFETNGKDGMPKMRANLVNAWKLGPFGAAWNVNFIGRNEADSLVETGGYTTHDLQFTWTTPMKGKVTIGALNILAKMPALVDHDGRNFNFNLYDSYGRQAYIRLEQKF